MNNQPSDTPRTDAALRNHIKQCLNNLEIKEGKAGVTGTVHPDGWNFARQLERELALATQPIPSLTPHFKSLAEIQNSTASKMTHFVEDWVAEKLARELSTANERLVKLEKDRERLDWVEMNSYFIALPKDNHWSVTSWLNGTKLRPHLDAAINSGKGK